MTSGPRLFWALPLLDAVVNHVRDLDRDRSFQAALDQSHDVPPLSAVPGGLV